MKKVIVINGVGASGKDTFCDIIAEHYNVRNVSSITPIKEIALKGGWKGEKTSESRMLLMQLKKVFTDYNDLPNNYILDQYNDFMEDEKEEVMFIHIREVSEIEKFCESVGNSCSTLLVRRPNREKWGNPSDDCVENMKYDFYYENNKNLNDMHEDALKFFNNNIIK